MAKSKYEIVSHSTTAVTIRDIGTHHTSVTNDAETVVKEMHKWGLGIRRLFYYDSDGDLSELLHDNKGGFDGFHA